MEMHGSDDQQHGHDGEHEHEERLHGCWRKALPPAPRAPHRAGGPGTAGWRPQLLPAARSAGWVAAPCHPRGPASARHGAGSQRPATREARRAHVMPSVPSTIRGDSCGFVDRPRASDAGGGWKRAQDEQEHGGDRGWFHDRGV